MTQGGIDVLLKMFIEQEITYNIKVDEVIKQFKL